jgi:integrase
MPRPNRGARLEQVPGRTPFYIVWYEGGAKRKRSTGTANSREAETILAEFIRERQRGQRIGPVDPGEFPVAQALDLYCDQHAPHTAAPERIGYATSALLTFWGENFVGDVSKETCRAYQKARGKAPGTIRRELTTLRAAINFAHSEGKITRTVPVWLPEKPEGKDRWLNRHEAARLLNAARTARSDVRLYLPLFIALALYTGARKEAVLSLRWPQIDMQRGRINFARGRTTTSKGRAHIPIPRKLMTFLRLARKRGNDVGYVVHDNGRQIKDIGDGKGGSFGTACKRAGLNDVTPHTLRHTRGTWLAQAGVELWEIGGWLGHSDDRTTALYAHHHPDYLDNARKAADRR